MQELLDLFLKLSALGTGAMLDIHSPCAAIAAAARCIATSVPEAWHPSSTGGWLGMTIGPVSIYVHNVPRPTGWTDPGTLARMHASDDAGQLVKDMAAMAEERARNATVIAAIRGTEHRPSAGWEERVLATAGGVL